MKILVVDVTYINNKDKLIKEKEKSDIANQEN